MILAQSRRAEVPVFLSQEELEDKESPARYAAKELCHYLGAMSGAVFSLLPYDPTLAGICVGCCAGVYDGSEGDDAFRIVTRGSRLCIDGGCRGVIYGVYELLERLGCRFFTRDCEYVPTLPTLEVEDGLDLSLRPAFEYREHNYADAVQSQRFAVKCRLNGSKMNIPARMGSCMKYAWYVHTFDKMVPVKVYGESHPEYFSLVNGERLVRDSGRTQLCLSNPDVFRLCCDAVRRVLRENPDARIVSISQNDSTGNYCTCDECRALDEREGSPAASVLHFTNRIAEALEEEFPNVIFDTLAYTYSRPIPKTIRNRHNVCVRLCSIEACFSHPFETCDDESRGVLLPDGTRRSFIRDLSDWGSMCDRVYIWDYTTCFAHYPTPHPNWRCLQPNLRAMKRNNVQGVFEQACWASRGNVDFNELRLYLLSKLLWDPDCDLATHRREFMEYYYGAAAPHLDEYLNLLCDTVEKENIHVGFNDKPLHAFLREELLDRYDALFDKAAAAVAGDPLRLWRVEKNRLSIRWVRLKRKTMLRGEYDVEEINRFFGDWRAFGLSRIDEWCNLETTHKALLDGKWRGIEYFAHWTGEEPEIP